MGVDQILVLMTCEICQRTLCHGDKYNMKICCGINYKPLKD